MENKNCLNCSYFHLYALPGEKYCTFSEALVHGVTFCGVNPEHADALFNAAEKCDTYKYKGSAAKIEKGCLEYIQELFDRRNRLEAKLTQLGSK